MAGDRALAGPHPRFLEIPTYGLEYHPSTTYVSGCGNMVSMLPSDDPESYLLATLHTQRYAPSSTRAFEMRPCQTENE